MSVAHDAAVYLAANIGTLTFGTNLFVGSEPTTPANVVTIYDTGGSAPSQSLAGDVFISRSTIQVRVRNSAYTTGYNLAVSIRDYLRDVVDASMNSVYYLGIMQTTEITHIGKKSTDAGETHVWTMNYELKKEDT